MSNPLFFHSVIKVETTLCDPPPPKLSIINIIFFDTGIFKYRFKLSILKYLEKEINELIYPIPYNFKITLN